MVQCDGAWGRNQSGNIQGQSREIFREEIVAQAWQFSKASQVDFLVWFHVMASLTSDSAYACFSGRLLTFVLLLRTPRSIISILFDGTIGFDATLCPFSHRRFCCRDRVTCQGVIGRSVVSVTRYCTSLDQDLPPFPPSKVTVTKRRMQSLQRFYLTMLGLTLCEKQLLCRVACHFV